MVFPFKLESALQKDQRLSARLAGWAMQNVLQEAIEAAREAALLLFNSVHVTVSTICRISFVCAQARIEMK
jgi:hypothetical protein